MNGRLRDRHEFQHLAARASAGQDCLVDLVLGDPRELAGIRKGVRKFVSDRGFGRIAGEISYSFPEPADFGQYLQRAMGSLGKLQTVRLSEQSFDEAVQLLASSESEPRKPF